MTESRELFLREQILANGRFIHQNQQKAFYNDHKHALPIPSLDIEVVLGGIPSGGFRACLVCMAMDRIMFVGGWRASRETALEALLAVLERPAEVILKSMGPREE